MADFLRYLNDCKLILVSNREPYEHVRGARGIEVRQPAGGLVSALDPTLRRTHGTWVAWGSGNADRETADESGRLRVPPDEQSYALRRVWLEDNEVEAYYDGFANRSLWPLCHMLIHHFEYRSEFWERYRAVNMRFAHAVADEAERCTGRSMAWIQDYHFALVSEFLRAMRPALFIHQFWHIPFPPPDVLRLLPGGTHEMILRGLLGNDLMEFQVERYAQNFLDCVARFIPTAVVDFAERTVCLNDHVVQVAAFPISVDFESYQEMARRPAAEAMAQTLRDRYARNGRQLGVCVDRVDYTKGIPERLRALELLWTEHPELRGRFSFLFVCTPSRSSVAAYVNLEREITEKVTALNAQFGTPDWTPIVLVSENVDSDLLAAVYRAADLCVVSSLQDGMNLVAKEFVAAQVDERGVLLLSRFTGAAEEVDDAILINPFNVDGFVGAIRTALDMPASERRDRMRRMRRRLRNNTIFDWLEAILTRSSDIMEERSSALRLATRAHRQSGPQVISAVAEIERIAGTRLDKSPLAIMLDIDGTIAPIAPTPEAAAVPPTVRSTIRRLASSPDVRIALITGRAAADAQRMIGGEGAWIIGNHGLELGSPDGDIAAVRNAQEYEKTIAEAARMLAPVAQGTAGARVENKRWTLSVHYRLVDQRRAPALIAESRDIARSLGLRATEGRRVVELRPPIDVNKGTAAVDFAERVGALQRGSVLYAGDDQSDEDAFKALRERAPNAVTIRVDSPTDEQPPASGAEFRLTSTDELAALLLWIAAKRGR